MSDKGVFYLFVYGSLRSGFRSPAYEYISRYFDLVADGKVRGRLFDMGEYPAAVPTSDDAWILGELYIARNKEEFSWAIGQLDDYEGVLVESHEQPLYRRELAEIVTGNATFKSWIYWYNGDTTGRPAIDSGDMIAYLRNKAG